MTDFSNIRQISLDAPESWQNKLFITLDFDWASDDVLADTIDLVESLDIPVTWFVTHATPLLERLRNNPKFELGVHPNFNHLLFEGSEGSGRSAREILERLLDIVPEAVSLRSHSVTQSSRLIELFYEFGFRFDCNDFIPLESGMEFKPWRHFFGICKIPYCWEDDVALHPGLRKSLQSIWEQPGLRVINFHPIHVSLNTHHPSDYEGSRASHRDWNALQTYIHPGYGIRSFLQELIRTAKSGALPAL